MQSFTTFLMFSAFLYSAYTITGLYLELENVSIGNALQLEAARLRAVPIRFKLVARAKFELAQPTCCRLRAFSCWYVTLRCDLKLWPGGLDLRHVTLNMCNRPASPRSNYVPNLSEIGQSEAELLQFEIWPNDVDHVSRVALCSGTVHKV